MLQSLNQLGLKRCLLFLLLVAIFGMCNVLYNISKSEPSIECGSRGDVSGSFDGDLTASGDASLSDNRPRSVVPTTVPTTETMAERRAHINKVCNSKEAGERWNPGGWRGGPWHSQSDELWYLFKDISVAWCPVYKAATTTLITLFKDKMNLNGETWRNEHDLQHFLALGDLETVNPEKYKFSFMITRHPLSRIASTYANKLIEAPVTSNKDAKYIHQVWMRANIGAEAILGWRDVKSRDFTKTKAWKEEAKIYWANIDKNPNSYDESLMDMDNPYLNPIIPTFEEFVKFVIDDLSDGYMRYRGNNQHWIPMSELCSVCQDDAEGMTVHDFIRFENWNEEVVPYVKSMNVIEKSSTALEHKNNPSVLSESHHKIDYYAQLHPGLVEQLESYFALDYELFRYKKYPDLDAKGLVIDHF